MKERVDPRLVRRLGTFGSAASLFSAAVGLSALSGWWFHVEVLKSWLPGQPSVRLNATVCMVLLALVLWSLRKKEEVDRPGQAAARIGAALVALVGLISLAENLLGWGLGMDQLLHAVRPGEEVGSVRPGLIPPIAALNLLLLGCGFLMLNWRTRRGHWPAQWLALASGIGSMFGILDFALGRHISHTHIALPGAIDFAVLSLGLVCIRAEWALGGVLTSTSAGAKLLRNVVPSALGVLGLMGWLLSTPLLTETHFTWLEVSVLALVSSLLVVLLVGWNARVLDRVERERQKAEEALQVSKEMLDGLLGRFEDSPIEIALRRWTTSGVVLAMLLTSLLGFLSWRSTRTAEEDADWVTHTRTVQTTLLAALGDAVDAETGERGFVMTGEESFLEPYWEGQSAVVQDLDTLRHQMTDNATQQKWLDLLDSQIIARTETARRIIDERRQTRTIPAEGELLEGKRRMDAVRTTISEMQQEERRLLDQRVEKTQKARRGTRIFAAAATLLGVVFLMLSGLFIRREVDRGAHLRARLKALNANLEVRVAERTSALRVSQERLRAVIQSAMDAVITVDDRYCILVFNDAAEKVFRCRATDVLGQSIGRFIPERFRAAHSGHMHAFGETGTTSRSMAELGTLWAVRADGQEFPIEASISQVEAAGERLFTIILRDSKRAEEALRRSNTRTRFALETARLGDWELDLTTLEATRSLLHDQIFGYQSLLPEWNFDIFLGHVHPDDREQVREKFQSCVSQGKRWEFECRIVCANGDIRWIWACGDRYQDSSSGATRMFGIVKDISDRKQAEAELRKREQHIRVLLESTAEAILGDDLDGNCTFCNPAAVRLLGYEAQDALLGKNLHAVMHHTRLDGKPLLVEDCQLAKAVGEGRGFHAEDLVFWRKDGTSFPAECWSHPLWDNGEAVGSVVNFFDITERRQAAEDIRRLNGELERRVIERTAQLQAANQELEAFTYSVSHDLRAPLRHISGFSKILTEEYGSSLAPEAQHHLQRIQEGTRRMGMLVDDLLNLGRVGRHEVRLQVTGLNTVANEVIADLNPELVGRQVEWKIGNLPFVECDPSLVRQVFENLLSNALKFTRPRSQAVIEIGQKDHDGAPVVFIRDNGVGFNIKYAAKLFGVFQRLHRAEDFEGTGVGLATVQRIIQKHGGRIWAEAELDKGATFYFTLAAFETGELETKAAIAGDPS